MKINFYQSKITITSNSMPNFKMQIRFFQNSNEALNYYHPNILFQTHQTRAYQEYSKSYFKKHSVGIDRIRLRPRPVKAANFEQYISSRKIGNVSNFFTDENVVFRTELSRCNLSEDLKKISRRILNKEYSEVARYIDIILETYPNLLSVLFCKILLNFNYSEVFYTFLVDEFEYLKFSRTDVVHFYHLYDEILVQSSECDKKKLLLQLLVGETKDFTNMFSVNPCVLPQIGIDFGDSECPPDREPVTLMSFHVEPIENTELVPLAIK